MSFETVSSKVASMTCPRPQGASRQVPRPIFQTFCDCASLIGGILLQKLELRLGAGCTGVASCPTEAQLESQPFGLTFEMVLLRILYIQHDPSL